MVQLKRVKKYRSLFIDTLAFFTGSLIFAVSINTFTVPNAIIPAGMTGISTMLNYLVRIPIGFSNILLNIPFFVWGILQKGSKFISKTIVATVVSSLAIDITSPIYPTYTGDKMLACIFGGVLSGIGLALIFIRGGTTGGTDLIAMLLGNRVKSISIAKLISILDTIVVLTSAFVYRTLEAPLYAIIVIFVATKVIDSVLYGTSAGAGKIMFIMSDKNSEIAEKITTDIERGITFLKSRGGYSAKQGEVILCAARRHEIYRIYDIIHSVDPNAFVIVGDAGEITGEGFKERSTASKN